MEVCDERTIPTVNHATYELQRFMFYKNDTLKPPLDRQKFSIPKHVRVTYSCNPLYRLQNPNNNVIGCEYVTTPRNGSIFVTAKAVWTSGAGIRCESGEKTM